MEDFTTFFFILICASVFYVYLENKASDVTYITHNNIEYLVRNLPDKEEAALLLSKIRERLSNLVEHVCTDSNKEENKTNDKAVDEERGQSLKRLKTNFRPNNITESSPGNKYTSYSINKGDKIVFCLRAKDGSDKLVDINTMMFVAIHELAHLMTKSIGHTTEFWDNMRFLLKEGIKIKVYVKQDFNSIPVDYCGTKITDTPLN
jgi:predicted metal-dependent hydrolase